MKRINLLPPAAQKDLRFQRWFASLRLWLMIVAATLLVTLAGQITAYIYLQYEKGILDERVEQLRSLSNQKENTEVKQQVAALNNNIADFSLLADTTPRWSKFLVAFAGMVPPGVKINSLVTDLTSKKVTIQGYSPTREDVILLYNNIKANEKNFFDIDYPLENISRASDVPFHFTFSIREDLLK